ncbi:MAG: GWxTD domain-containing protein, partial [Calditrichaeota bacterium]
HKLALSSILLLEGNPGSGHDLHFKLGDAYTEKDREAGIDFKVSGLNPADSVEIFYRLQNWNGQTVEAWSEKSAAGQEILEIRRSIQSHIRYPGRFGLSIQCRQGSRQARGEVYFSVKYLPDGTPQNSLTSLRMDEIGPLKYILPKNEYKKIAQADSATRLQLVEAFWARRDPTPETPENELRQEFRRRVLFANTYFSINPRQKQGWQTDRGRIYIRYGPPNWVRNRTPEFGGKPIEVWYYKSIDRRFIFRDKKENGDFVLVYEE